MSVEKALRMALQENRALGGQEGGAEAIERILINYSRMYQQPAEVFKRPPRLTKKPSRAEVVDSALERILNSPMMIAATESEVVELPYKEDVGYSMIRLTSEQLQQITDNQDNSARAADITALGFSEFLRVGSEGDIIQAILASKDDRPVMWTNQFGVGKQDQQPQVEQVSDDGRVLIVKTKEGGVLRLKVFHLWQNDPTVLVSSINEEATAHLEVTKDGSHLFEQIRNSVFLARTADVYDLAKQQRGPGEAFRSFGEGKNFRLSPDGRFVMVEDLIGDQTKLYEVNRLDQLIVTTDKVTPISDCILPGNGYLFATSGLIIHKEKQVGIVIKPKSDLDVWQRSNQ